MNELEQIVGEAIAQFAVTSDAAELERVKAGYLGKSGRLTEHAMKIPLLPEEGCPRSGRGGQAAERRTTPALRATPPFPRRGTSQ